jgi:preprotein translocase subunit Sec63
MLPERVLETFRKRSGNVFGAVRAIGSLSRKRSGNVLDTLRKNMLNFASDVLGWASGRGNLQTYIATNGV